MRIKLLRDDLAWYLKKHNLTEKYNKSKVLFQQNPFYPSLHVELLEPKHRHIYSFRLDRKYRALFIYTGEEEIEIIAFTNHYK
jgi:Txe/YoeB family toxin of Txe-Axe toxin-antitoxin module